MREQAYDMCVGWHDNIHGTDKYFSKKDLLKMLNRTNLSIMRSRTIPVYADDPDNEDETIIVGRVLRVESAGDRIRIHSKVQDNYQVVGVLLT